jgi:glycosyltransferase involved in cell wall biosynthesis
VSELVLVDDGSRDGGLEVAREAWSDPRPLIIAEYKEARGVGAARNLGIRLCSSPMIAQLDGDDFWLPGKTRAQLQALGDDQLAVSFTLVEQFLDGVPCPKILKPETIGVPLNVALPSSLLCHRRVYELVGGFDENIPCANDIDWFRRAFGLGHRRIDVPEVFVKKRIHGNNLSLHQGHDMTKQLLRVLSKPVVRP